MPHYSKSKGFFIFCILVFIFSLSLLSPFHSKAAELKAPTAERGVLDLSHWDFKRNGPVSLNGDWEFYWKRDSRPGHYSKEDWTYSKTYIPVPGIWNNLPVDSVPISGSGFATYRLKIILPKEFPPLAFRFIDIATTFSAFVNGREIVTIGVPGNSPEKSSPQFHPKIVDFGVSSGEIDLTIFVSNYHHYKGGIWEAIEMGDSEGLKDRRENKLIFTWFLAGAILIIAFYHLGLTLNRPQDHSSLFFGFFCLIVFARILTTGERPIIQLFPNFNWELMTKISYLSFYAGIPLFTWYVKSLFPGELNKKALQVIALIGIIFSLGVVFTPALIYTKTLYIYQIFSLTVFSYGFYVLFRAVRNKREGSLAFLVGYCIIIVTAINDILYSHLILPTAYLFPFGLFIFTFSQAFILSNRFSKAFKTVEVQQGKLLEANAAYSGEIEERKRVQEMLRRSHEELDHRVKERTAELVAANKNLEREIAERVAAEGQLRQSQKMEAIGMLSGGIAHDFNNILSPIIINSELGLLDVDEGSKLRRNFEFILKSGLRGKELVKQLLLFSRKSEKRLRTLRLTPLLKETFNLLRASIPATIQMKLEVETESDTVYADPSQVQQIVMNLCTNAAYAMRGATGSIHISLQNTRLNSRDLPEADMKPGEYLVLSVSDTGCGMDEEVKKRIFEPFFTTKPAGEGTGLGLSVVYGIVKDHKGSIQVFSEPGKVPFSVYTCHRLILAPQYAQKQLDPFPQEMNGSCSWMMRN